MKQNITLRLEKSLIRRARVIAAKKALSISGLLGEKLEEVIRKTEQYERAKRAALADLEAGFSLGGRGIESRDALHDR